MHLTALLIIIVQMLSDSKIEELYEEHITVNYTEEYKNRYHPLPVDKNNKNWKWEGKDFPRVISLLEFERYVNKYTTFILKNYYYLMGTNEPETEYLEGRYKQVLNINYEDNPEKYNLHNLQINHNNFDFVTLNQTLEHVYNPYTCLTNIKGYIDQRRIFIYKCTCL